MSNKVHERVLLDNGEFGHFPQRIIDSSVQRGEREPVVEPQPEPLIPHGEKGKAELEAKAKRSKKAK
jgi:hypothetical protein